MALSTRRHAHVTGHMGVSISSRITRPCEHPQNWDCRYKLVKKLFSHASPAPLAVNIGASELCASSIKRCERSVEMVQYWLRCGGDSSLLMRWMKGRLDRNKGIDVKWYNENQMRDTQCRQNQDALTSAICCESGFWLGKFWTLLRWYSWGKLLVLTVANQPKERWFWT